MVNRPTRRLMFPACFVLTLAIMPFLVTPAAAQYKQVNLVSDERGKAAKALHTDPNLKNGWGLAFFPNSPFWVSDNDTGVATLYRHFGTKVPLVVTIPPAPSQPFGPVGSPTGIVANPTSQFVVSAGGLSGTALFIFDTLDGTISGWNPGVDLTQAVIAVDNSSSGSVYTGLAIGQTSLGENVIFAANATLNTIEVYDGSFSLVNSFTDTNNPTPFTPYGIQVISGNLYVTFASPVVPGGFVDVFTVDGTFIRRFGSSLDGVPVDAPWGMALAPANFGRFSNDLLVGNLNSGLIDAFDPNTGAFLGQVEDVHGNPIQIGGLWALAFGGGGRNNGKTNQLFFTSGPTFPPHTGEYADGLFGVLLPNERK